LREAFRAKSVRAPGACGEGKGGRCDGVMEVSRLGVETVLIDCPSEGRGRIRERRPGVAVVVAMEEFVFVFYLDTAGAAFRIIRRRAGSKVP